MESLNAEQTDRMVSFIKKTRLSQSLKDIYFSLKPAETIPNVNIHLKVEHEWDVS